MTLAPAIKLGNLSVDEHDLEHYVDGLRIQYGETHHNVFYGISYYNLKKPKELELLSKILPTGKQNKFGAAMMKINSPYVHPHTDSGIRFSINYYIETGNAKTVFYKKKYEKVKENKIENQTNGSVYDRNDLDSYFEFVAEKGDIWILDVTQIHSVENVDPNIIRKAITLTNGMNYFQVCQLLGVNN